MWSLKFVPTCKFKDCLKLIGDYNVWRSLGVGEWSDMEDFLVCLIFENLSEEGDYWKCLKFYFESICKSLIFSVKIYIFIRDFVTIIKKYYIVRFFF